MDDASQSRFAACLVEFNLHPARGAHPSWFPAALDAFDAGSDPRYDAALSDWLLRRLDVAHATDWQMREPLKRLFLLDRTSLAKLARELSLAMHRSSVARVIDGMALRAMHRRIDPDSWRFVLHGIPEGALCDAQPTIDFEEGAEPLAAQLENDGCRALLAMIPDAWLAIRQRARLRFDASVDHQVPPFSAERTDAALNLIRCHLIPRRLPQWAWLL